MASGPTYKTDCLGHGCAVLRGVRSPHPTARVSTVLVAKMNSRPESIGSVPFLADRR